MRCYENVYITMNVTNVMRKLKIFFWPFCCQADIMVLRCTFIDHQILGSGFWRSQFVGSETKRNTKAY